MVGAYAPMCQSKFRFLCTMLVVVYSIMLKNVKMIFLDKWQLYLYKQRLFTMFITYNVPNYLRNFMEPT